MPAPPRLEKVSRGRIYDDMYASVQQKRMSPSSGISAFALGVGRVLRVNYEELSVTLRIVIGEDQEFQRLPVPLTLPGVGKRHFFGAIPQTGDYCIVGWMPQDSGGTGNQVGTKIPVILTWMPAGVWAGQDWMVAQSFPLDEFSMSPKDKSFTDGVFERVRHKMRHAQPGNIIASSAQGSDLALDEGVLLTNRRCNELRLRDQDQALVLRTLQQYHAMAGARIYGGMVHREGLFLPPAMVSDGKDWAAFNQVLLSPVTGDWEPVHEEDLPESIPDAGFLTPAQIYKRAPAKSGGGLTSPQGPPLPTNLDPFVFLRRGLFLNPDGFIADPDVVPSDMYGGKPLLRIAVPGGDDNEVYSSAAASDAQSLTEYRIEVAHTSDGRLPVTEQTDHFDADRLPRSSPNNVDPEGLSPNSPFIDVVYGSVVGNDPFSNAGRRVYGHPLRAEVFDDKGEPNPQMVSALGTELKEHAATLFKLKPPTEEGGPETFWSVTKDGRVRMSLGGDQKANSAEITMRGGLKLFVGGPVELNFDGGYKINTKKGDPQNNNFGLDLGSDAGAVKIYGGGDSNLGEASELASGSGMFSPAAMPSLLLEGRNVTVVKASQQVQIKSNIFESDTSQVNLNALSSIEMSAGDKISLNSKVWEVNISGKTTQNYSGPRDNLPTNGPHREVTFTSLIPGLTVDKYTVTLGNREENFTLGNHSTTIKVGDMTYETNLGTWKAKAGLNELSLNTTSGLDGNIVVGNVNIDAKTGAATIAGTLSVTVKSSAGRAVLSGLVGAFLGGPGKIGNIVSSSDLDPLTGLPLLTFGMGSPGHQIGLPVL